MTSGEILERYSRAQKTQKRRTTLRLIITGSVFTTAILNYLNISYFTNVRLMLFILVLLFMIYSYTIGRRIGAANDYKAIADYYMQNDKRINALKQ